MKQLTHDTPAEDVLEVVDKARLDHIYTLLGYSLLVNGVLFGLLLISWGQWTSGLLFMAATSGVLYYADKHS